MNPLDPVSYELLGSCISSFSKVIKRTGGVPTIKPTVEKDNFFDDDDDNEDKDDGFDEIETIDLDSIVDESTETDD